eukprot:c4684_g1_i1 orf=130-1191(+)
MECGDSLLCEEEIIGSPWLDISERSEFNIEGRNMSYGSQDVFTNCVLEDGETIAYLVDKELQFMPHGDYVTELHSSDNCARSRAVRWVLKAQRFFNFCPLTATLAVNYLDRYLAKNISKPWKAWMLELLSVACLSIAAKLEEVEVPSLLDLQIDGLEYLFETATVQRMETNILNALGWKLRSVTPFGFVEKALHNLDLTQRFKASLLTRISELLLGSLEEAEFLHFRSSVIAVSAMCCALDEAAPFQSGSLKASLIEMIPVDKVNFLHCFRSMEELIADPLPALTSEFGDPKSASSPVAVVPEMNNAQRDYENIVGHDFDSNFVKRGDQSINELIFLSPDSNRSKRKRRMHPH